MSETTEQQEVAVADSTDAKSMASPRGSGGGLGPDLSTNGLALTLIMVCAFSAATSYYVASAVAPMLISFIVLMAEWSADAVGYGPYSKQMLNDPAFPFFTRSVRGDVSLGVRALFLPLTAPWIYLISGVLTLLVTPPCKWPDGYTRGVSDGAVKWTAPDGTKWDEDSPTSPKAYACAAEFTGQALLGLFLLTLISRFMYREQGPARLGDKAAALFASTGLPHYSDLSCDYARWFALAYTATFLFALVFVSTSGPPTFFAATAAEDASLSSRSAAGALRRGALTEAAAILAQRAFVALHLSLLGKPPRAGQPPAPAPARQGAAQGSEPARRPADAPPLALPPLPRLPPPPPPPPPPPLQGWPVAREQAPPAEQAPWRAPPAAAAARAVEAAQAGQQAGQHATEPSASVAAAPTVEPSAVPSASPAPPRAAAVPRAAHLRVSNLLAALLGTRTAPPADAGLASRTEGRAAAPPATTLPAPAAAITAASPTAAPAPAPAATPAPAAAPATTPTAAPATPAVAAAVAAPTRRHGALPSLHPPRPLPALWARPLPPQKQFTVTPAYGVTADVEATSSYGGVRLLLAMLLTWMMGGSTAQFMVPLFLNVARALPPFTGDPLKLPLAERFPANPEQAYPGLGADGRQDAEMPTTWAPSAEYLTPT